MWNIKCFFFWFNYALGFFQNIIRHTALQTQRISDQYHEVSSCKILQAKVSEIWLCCNYDWPHANNGHGFTMHQIAQVTNLNLFPHGTFYQNLSFQSIIICVERFHLHESPRNMMVTPCHYIVIWSNVYLTNFSNIESKLNAHFLSISWDGGYTLHQLCIIHPINSLNPKF